MKATEGSTHGLGTPKAEAVQDVSQATVPERNGSSPMSKHEFELKNERRLALVNKKYGVGLTEEESLELTRQTADIDRYLDALSPTTDDIINHLKALGRKAGVSLDEFDK